MSTDRCPGHSDGRHIPDGMGGCMGKDCPETFPGPNLTTPMTTRYRLCADHQDNTYGLIPMGTIVYQQYAVPGGAFVTTTVYGTGRGFLCPTDKLMPAPLGSTTPIPQPPERQTMNWTPNDKEMAEGVARQRADQAKSFEDFKASPTVKLLIDMIPATQPPQLLDTLLRAAHDHGCNTGAASVGMEVARMMTSSLSSAMADIRKDLDGGKVGDVH